MVCITTDSVIQKKKRYSITVANDSEFDTWNHKIVTNAKDAVEAIYEIIGF